MARKPEEMSWFIKLLLTAFFMVGGWTVLFW
jgi:hypothetical protein